MSTSLWGVSSPRAKEPKIHALRTGCVSKYSAIFCCIISLVMAGVKADDLDDRIGYYGEQLVLLAQTLGMNTCRSMLLYLTANSPTVASSRCLM